MGIARPTTADTTSFGIHPSTFRLPATARIGRVRLAVSQLARSVHFYSEVIGLAVLEREGNLAKLGAKHSQRVLLELEELPGVHPLGRRTRLGLYHTAFLLPSRSALSNFVQHLRRDEIEFGAGDHLYSEAIYLVDPDGLSVEVYADRPRSEWVVENGELLTGVEPVRFETFPVVAADDWRGAPAGTTMGHVHFYVGDLEQAKKFYHSGLGLDITTWRYPGALFTSAGGYHHHVGLNVWVAQSPVASTEDSRLLFWEILLPDSGEIQRAAESLMKAGYPPLQQGNGLLFRDPWGITVALRIADPNDR
ncbi:VOC family protein [Edaphobacter sp. HDX4]|uniref:VOC family protein n=1 Tax=Edaphobacter sp. HDX4 TaxID=2794064 RepID=UPI002FE5118C